MSCTQALQYLHYIKNSVNHHASSSRNPSSCWSHSKYPLLLQRTYYVNYPITGSDYYDYYYNTLNLPSSTYLPKVYRWYYSWPRVYNTSYWPLARTYLSNYLRNYYQNTDWPSYYWSSHLPWLKNLDYDFKDLEFKIDNLRVSRILW